MTVMKVAVELGDRSYDVVVGAGVRHELPAIITAKAPRAQRAVIVTSEALVAQPWTDISTGIPSSVITVPDGEAAKNFAEVERLCTEFSRLELSRHDVVVAFGGGAVTDLVGFAAAVYLRGIAVIHLATSLVAQVDAAIGGKTAVNLVTGKNLMGAFHQPLAVLCDLDFLETLGARELGDGRGEIVKCCLLDGLSPTEMASLSPYDQVLLSVSLKARIVSQDEREGGLRALLNYGHTLAHAIEALVLDGHDLDIRHGEAVAIGLAYAVRLARHLGRVDDATVQAHDEALQLFGLSGALPPGLKIKALVDAMGRDKKAHHNLTFVLPGPNGFETVSDIARSDVELVLRSFGGVE
jgi:5-deoxy-5-amino-3-dehydroquinate synthase